MTVHKLDRIPTRPAVVSAQYGTVLISDAVDDVVTAVVEHFEAGATAIKIAYLDDAP